MRFVLVRILAKDTTEDCLGQCIFIFYANYPRNDDFIF